MMETTSSLTLWRPSNYHYISHAIPLSFLRVQQLLKDQTCITPKCRSCKVLFSTAHPPRQLTCSHVLCGPCISEKCIRENDCRCLVCAMKATPPTFEYGMKDGGLKEFPRMYPKLFRDMVSKAIFGYRYCLEREGYESLETMKSHSRHGLGQPNLERSLCYVGQRERHKLTVAAMVIMGCSRLTPSTQEGKEGEGGCNPADQKAASFSSFSSSSSSSFSTSDAEIWLYALWEGIDNLNSSVYHDTHAELTSSIVIETRKAADKVKTINLEGAEMTILSEEVGKVVALAGEFESMITLCCREMNQIDMRANYHFWCTLHKWETGVAS